MPIPLTRPTPNAERLAEHATEIRKYQERTFENIVAIGRHLLEAKKLAGPGNWLSWLKGEFAWSESTARNLMRVAAHPQRIADLKLPVRSLYLLAAPSTPEAARKTVAKKAKTTAVKHQEVVEAVRAAKPQKPHTVQSARTEPPTYQIQHTEPAEAPFNWLLFVSRAEASSSFFERHQDEWREASRRKSQMPAELRDRLLDCLKSLADQVNDMTAEFEVPITH